MLSEAGAEFVWMTKMMVWFFAAERYQTCNQKMMVDVTWKTWRCEIAFCIAEHRRLIFSAQVAIIELLERALLLS